jgi:hypothetical protein
VCDQRRDRQGAFASLADDVLHARSERSLTVAALPEYFVIGAPEYNAVRGHPMRVLGAISFLLFLAAGLPAQNGGQPVLRGTAGSGMHLTVPGQNNRRIPPARSKVIVYPVYIGGTYDSSYIGAQAQPDYQQQQPPNITIVMPPEQTAVPVIINNYYPGATTDNPNAGPTAPQSADDTAPVSEPSHYLIAYKDHTIYAAVAYWVDGETLHYFTAGNTHNQVSLTLVDRDLTARLNREAGVEVKLSAPSK